MVFPHKGEQFGLHITKKCEAEGVIFGTKVKYRQQKPILKCFLYDFVKEIQFASNLLVALCL